MRWFILGVAVAALVLVLWGVRIEHAGRSADEALGAVVPWTVAAILFGLDAALLVLLAARRLL